MWLVVGGAVQTLDAASLVPPRLRRRSSSGDPISARRSRCWWRRTRRIGVAKADYFPRIGLTGVFGVESRDLTELLTAPARTWSVAQPRPHRSSMRDARRGNVRLSESVERELVVNYQRTILPAAVGIAPRAQPQSSSCCGACADAGVLRCSIVRR